MDTEYQPDLFRSSLPFRMACTDDLEAGQHYEARARAILRAYVNPNPKALVWASVYDIDRPHGALAWQDAPKPAPTPNWTATNPENGHAHLGYILAAPVARSLKARGGPLRYLARIEHGLTALLDADRAYTHGLTKNPVHPRWRVSWLTERPYELDELRDYLGDVLPLRISRQEAVGLGRNVTLFDGLRFWAYKNRPAYAAYPPWLIACRHYAEGLNQFACPLPTREVHQVAKSVAGWTWRRPAWRADRLAEFKARQAHRQARWVAKKRAAALDLHAQILEMHP